jgi:hypothetical protein
MLDFVYKDEHFSLKVSVKWLKQEKQDAPLNIFRKHIYFAVISYKERIGFQIPNTILRI